MRPTCFAQALGTGDRKNTSSSGGGPGVVQSTAGTVVALSAQASPPPSGTWRMPLVRGKASHPVGQSLGSKAASYHRDVRTNHKHESLGQGF